MPTYIYFDPITLEEKEVVHSINEAPTIINEKTGNVMKRKITQISGILYKGSGWTKSAKSPSYNLDKYKDEIRSGLKPDPYKKFRDKGESI